MKKSVVRVMTNVPAISLGAGLLLFSLFMLKLPLPIALLVSVGGYLVAELLIFPSKKATETHHPDLSGMSEHEKAVFHEYEKITEDAASNSERNENIAATSMKSMKEGK